MNEPFASLLRFTALSLLVGALPAQVKLAPDMIPLDSLDSFKPTAANWRVAGDLAGDPRRERELVAHDGRGILVCNPTKEARGNLLTSWEHGDLELDLEFLLPPGSNSGVYLQGRYEVQLYDSWGVAKPTYVDCGAIYARHDPSRPKGTESFEGVPPRTNATRAPGLWQQLHIGFEAPRFDADGRKTRNARFTRVALNGFVIHENVAVSGPTRGARFNDERALGPLMIQGDHGPVALRNLAVKRFDARVAITTTDIRYKLHPGTYEQVGTYDQEPPKSEGALERFAPDAVNKSGKFALVFVGTLTVPRDGAYRFAVSSGGTARLLIDGREVVVPLDRASQPGVVSLAAGPHTFRLDLVHATSAHPSFDLVAEGPGIAPRSLMDAPAKKTSEAPPLLVNPTDRILVQRGFVPFEPRKRLYAVSVGTPAGVHFAYDCETGALLRAWRGPFIDTSAMWEARGNDQLARPAGPALTFNGKPAVAMIEYARDGGWPEEPEPLWSFLGYSLEKDGQPVFRAKLASLEIRDHIAPTNGRGLTRTMEFKGELPSWSAWVLLAEAGIITPQPEQQGWIIGQRAWYLDWPRDAALQPVIRESRGCQQLVIPLTSLALRQTITYSIVW